MRIDAVNVNNQSQLISDYRNHEKVMQFFDYLPYDSLENRVHELQNRTFKREELASILESCNKGWGAGHSTMEAISKITDPESVVVVGGQQAGLLTGPLYTVNKIISILQYAREQERKLGVPVLPVFWIAGEDHDYEEINHIFLPKENRLEKYKYNQSPSHKHSISEMKLDKNLGQDWVNELFTALPETIHTKEIYEAILECIDRSNTFTDFFANLIHFLFQEEGLILIDSADEKVRNLESDYFIELIENQPKISKGVYETAKKVESLGYPVALEVEPNEGHLFYHLNGERILLQRTDKGTWQGKLNEIELTTEELLLLAKSEPEKLSNNVVTRPIMQELLLPTLAFIGGPGEISYWALLKPGFHALDLKMPPIIPRLSFTYVPGYAEKALKRTGVSIHTAINEGSKKDKEAWILEQQEPPIKNLAEDLKETIRKAHEPIQKVAKEIRVDMGGLADKNLQIIQREIDYLSNRMEKALEEKHEKNLEPFDTIQYVLHPDNGLQERVWNILPFINEYGIEFIAKLSHTFCSFEEEHYVVYL